MSLPVDFESTRSPDPPTHDRRTHQRHAGKALVEIVREADSRRIGLAVSLINVSVSGVGVLSEHSFACDERVKVIIRNDVRRFLKDVLGVVRWSQPTDDGRFRIGIELSTRFSVHDLQNLKHVGMSNDSEQKVWI